MRTAPPSPDLSELPLLRYGGEIVLVDRPELLNEVVPLLLAEPYLGFDTETRPAFKKGEKYAPALVQLASPQRVYLLQLRELGITDALVTLLEAAAAAQGWHCHPRRHQSPARGATVCAQRSGGSG
jgi:hypothetical protein